MAKTVLLWDIDGTLLLTGGCGKIAFNRIFKQLYNEDDIWQNMKPDGKTDIVIIKECYERRFHKLPTEEEIDKIVAAYILENKIELKRAERFRLMPHVENTLFRLSQSRNIAMGLATGNLKVPGFDKLKRGGIDHHFRFGGFACDAEDRLELTQKALHEAVKFIKDIPEQVYVIGDTVHDIRCGKAIGAKTIGVCTGSTKEEELAEAGADQIINDLSEMALNIEF